MSGRVLAGLRQLNGALKLSIDEAKSAVASAFGRKLLGYELWAGKGGAVKRAVADRAIQAFKDRVRQITRRSGRGGSMPEAIERLRDCVPRWKA